MTDRYYREEEEFHAKDRKQFRKERRLAESTDRSKFKKTDLDKKAAAAEPLDAASYRKGRVVAIVGEGVVVDLSGTRVLCSLKGLMKKENLQMKNLAAVGDNVWVDEQDTIAHIEERNSFLSRQDLTGKKEQLIAVNIDQVLIVASLVEPPLKPALIDRYLIAAEKGKMHSIIVVNKIDLLEEASLEDKQLFREFLAAYEPLGIPILSVSYKTGVGLDNLRLLMQNKTSVFSGQSGVGKSSLLNAAFAFELKTGELTQKTAKGSHTTTTAELLSLPQGGFCIDTPGIRSFGVWALTKEDIAAHYREFTPFAHDCRFDNCTHLNEPSCKVRQAVAEGRLSSLRFESYASLLREILEGIDQRTKRKMEPS